MKKSNAKRDASKGADVDEILPEYDFSRGARNKFASRYTVGSLLLC